MTNSTGPVYFVLSRPTTPFFFDSDSPASVPSDCSALKSPAPGKTRHDLELAVVDTSARDRNDELKAMRAVPGGGDTASTSAIVTAAVKSNAYAAVPQTGEVTETETRITVKMPTGRDIITSRIS